MKTKEQTRIIVGMSGGVDSSVAAMLLKQQGYNVEGVFMKNWEADDDEFCTAEQDIADAKTVCMQLQIPFHTVNFAKKYWDHVFQYFLEEYQHGRTPNPDILCNKEIKFKAFLEYALSLGADYIATGHYARIEKIADEFQLLQAVDQNKDQTYFLYTLNQYQLSKSMFPLGQLDKKQVRELATQAQFINSNKKDSTGICFIGERHFKTFLSEYLLTKPGEIRSIDDDKVLGKHDGLMFYTLGQRKGLHIGGVKNQQEAPWYVVKKDLANNILYIAQSHDHPANYAQGLICKNIHWVSEKMPTQPFLCQAKTRYRHPQQRCNVTPSTNNNDFLFEVLFDEKQWAITPGQSVVFYQEEQCLGGAIIEEVLA